MPVRNYKPITNGTRNMSTLVNDEITKSTPEKSLLKKARKTCLIYVLVSYYKRK